MPPDYIDMEELRRFMRNGGGTNLAGQGGGGILGRLRNQAKQKTDPTYSSGFNYAQQIAGGVIPNSQVIAPGVSYSPEQAGGYTQADLDFIARGPAPVMPIAPTTGEVATIPNQMPYAPPGVTQPTPFNIGNTLFPNVDYLQGLDFSGLPALGNIDVDAIIKEYQDRQDAGEPEPFESFFTDFSPAPVMPQAPVTIADSVTPGLFDITPELTAEPIYDRYIDEQIIPSFIPQSVVNKVPVMPSIPGEPEPFFEPRVPVQIAAPVTPVQKLPQSIFANIPQPVIPQPIPQIPNFEIQQLGLPMNFTGLPNMPNMPVMPRIPQTTYIPPASSFIQPRVEEIVSPIRSGSLRNFQQPGLFNLV